MAAAVLFQKTILPESILTSGLGASGATPEFDPEGRPVIEMPLDAAGEVSVALRCGRILEPYAPTAPLEVRLRFSANTGAYPFAFKVQCCAKGTGENVATQDWNAEESSTSGTFPLPSWELDEAEITVPTGAARDNLSSGEELDVLIRLLPDASRPAGKVLRIREVEVRQELPAG